MSFHEPDDKLRDNLLNPARGFYIDSITSARYFQPLTVRQILDTSGIKKKALFWDHDVRMYHSIFP